MVVAGANLGTVSGMLGKYSLVYSPEWLVQADLRRKEHQPAVHLGRNEIRWLGLVQSYDPEANQFAVPSDYRAT